MGSPVLGLLSSPHPAGIMAAEAEALGLKKKEIDAIDFAFDVYDFKGDGKVDAFYVGDVLRATNINPTLRMIKSVGGTEEKEEKVVKDAKDSGGFHDFVEILKLLINLGEKLTKEEAKNLMNEMCEPEDAEGFMEYKPFLEKMCASSKQ